MREPVFLAATLIGVLTGLSDYFYAYGVARLPVSTSALKFTPYSINAVALLTVGAGVLALHASSDRAKGEPNKEYYMGFFMTVAAAVLYGFILPLVKLTYRKARQAITYTLVLEIQLVMCFFATLVCTIGMVINKDFKCFFLGAIGVVVSASSLFSAIITTVLLPVIEILASCYFLQRKVPGRQRVSLVLSLWGFASYFYGEIKPSEEKSTETQILEMYTPPNDS
ncbi:hypothetical protein RHSIM_Rhsim07G0208700 [Rhododendron simsii]|uniref:Uncharacterized protein n=1 Tax=Rhododendron simsii TaxID=118357 RepID=A0A834LJJ3_RHOSS|nr:hypothetical protein RHSIM_Rhsim07G0208700 [Rhododendron simsii]